MPTRIQRRRTKGWRTPICSCGCGKPARYVGRGTRCGNPWRVVHWCDAVDNVTVWAVESSDDDTEVVSTYRQVPGDLHSPEHLAHADAVQRFYAWARWAFSNADFDELRGHDVACWCPPARPCHADTLLDLANKEAL